MAPVMLVDFLEQCYSIAFSLRIILANFPSWTLLDHHKRPFTTETDFKSIVSACLSHVEKPAAPVKPKVTVKPQKPSTSLPKSHLFKVDTTPRKKDIAKRSAETEVDDMTSPAKKKAKR